MKYTKYLKIFFFIAGIILSVKPLIGFGVIHNAKRIEVSPDYSLLRLLFTRRVPDSLADGKAKISTLHQKLKDAGLAYTPTLFSLIFGITSLLLIKVKETKRYLLELLLLLIPEKDLYLSTGKLTI